MSATVERDPPTPPEEEEAAAALDAYSRIVVGVAERVSGSIGSLRVLRRGRGGRVPAGAGSAVALTPDGFMITSAHVVSGPGRTGRVALVDGRELSFDVVGLDRLSDLAVLRAGRNQIAKCAEMGALRKGIP